MPRRALFLERMDEWKMSLEARNLSKGTVETYTYTVGEAWKYALQKGWPQDPRKITPALVRDYLGFLRIYSSGTQANYATTLLLFLKWCGNTKFQEFKLRITVERSRVDWLTVEEVPVILATAPSMFIRAMEVMFIFTGIRESELADLRMEDVTKEYIIVRGKGVKFRKIPVTAQFWTAIGEYIAWRSTVKGPLFMMHPAGRGCPLGPYTVDGIKTAIYRHWKAITRHISPHTFRRSFGKHLHKQGMPIVEIKRLYGHKSLETTERYLGIMDEDLAVSLAEHQPVYS